MTPLTNSGMTVIDSVETVIVRSRMLSRRRPANTPSKIDSGHDDDERERRPGRSELPSAAMTVGKTGCSVSCATLPQLPVTKWPAQVT